MATYSHTVEIDRPRRSAIETRDGPVPFRATFDLQEEGERTRFTWTVETRGPAARLAGPVVARAMRRELRLSSGRLKALLEEDRLAPARRRRQNGSGR